MQKIILIGSGGHAKSVIDTIEKIGTFEIVGLIDKNKEANYKNYKVLGNDNDLIRIFEQGIDSAFITIGFLGKTDIRKKLYDILKNIGFQIPSIIDPSAILANDVTIKEGVYIGKGAIINSNSIVEKMSIINTNSVVEHDCKIDEFAHVSVSATVCGGVTIGNNVFIGANATVIQGCTIGDNAIIGAGTTVIQNIMSDKIYYGLGK